MSNQPLTLADVVKNYAKACTTKIDTAAILARIEKLEKELNTSTRLEAYHTAAQNRDLDNAKTALRIIEAEQRFRRLNMAFMSETHKQGRLVVPSFAMIAEEQHHPDCTLSVEARWDVWPFTKSASLRRWRSEEFIKALDEGVVSSLKAEASRRLGFWMEDAFIEISIRFNGALPEQQRAMLNQQKDAENGIRSLDFDDIYIIGDAPKWRIAPETFSTEATQEGLHALVGRIDKYYWLIDSFDAHESGVFNINDFVVDTSENLGLQDL